MRQLSLLSLASLVFTLGCPGDPGELRPLFDEIVGLPAYLVDPTPLPSFEMPLRNIGASAVTISEFSVEDADGAEGQSASFIDLEFDVTTVEPEEQAVMRFRYRTPGGAAQSALIVIATDSTTRPSIEIPVATVEYIPPVVFDGGDGDDAGAPPDGGDDDDAGTPIDAGGGDDDAGTPVDAGGGGDDAGAPIDAGGGGDAGAPVDAGGGDDAGAPVDAGSSDAG